MAHDHCRNEICLDRQTQLRLARVREELLTNFNTLLIDRIRFLEQTITRLALHSPPPPPITPVKSQLLTPPHPHLRRSSSATTYYLAARSCPSSVDLSNPSSSRLLDRTASTGSRKPSSTPIYRPWTSSSANDVNCALPFGSNEKGRLESRRFACDVDDNDVRALKAMIYMEQARKQHTRPLHRLRQVLRMNSANPSHFQQWKK